MRPNENASGLYKRQQGNTLVLAVFVIVVLGGLVAALASLFRSTSESVVVEVLGTRSFLSAQSGLEQGMMELYPLNQQPAANCSNVTENPPLPTVAGLVNCQVEVTCVVQTHTPDSAEAYTHIRLEALGSCQAGEQRASRQLAIETRLRE